MAGPADGANPIAVIKDTPMGSRQVIVVILMVMLNALDGFDVLSSAFAAPGIMEDWGITRTELGVVLSAELIGMGFGSVLLGGAADRYGRKATMLGCLVIMTIGMYMASQSDAVTPMTIWRFITGLGIGGMLASTNAVVAEVTSRTGRSVSMAFYVIGYPVGGVIGGFAAQGWLLVDYDWRAVFVFGAVVTALMIPLVMLLVPETPAYYVARRPTDALAKVNKSLAAFGKPPLASLPVIEESGPKPKATDILANPRLRPVTLLLAFGYLFHTFTFYYILKNAPTIVALSDPSFTQADGASSLTYANIGGAVGGAIFGFFLKKFGLKGPTIAALALGVAAVLYFGLGHESLWTWRIAALLTMFFLNAAIVGYYAAFALSFPAYARASGTGFVLGVGRAGAAGSPIVAGALFDYFGSEELFLVSAIMSLGSVIAIALMWVMPIRDADDEMDVAAADRARAAT